MPLLYRRALPTEVNAGATGDCALVVAAQRDPAEFAPLFARYWDFVLRYCVVRLGNRQDAEDAASQIFVDAYAGLGRFQHGGAEDTFRAWLFTIAHHEVANRYRYWKRHPASPLEAANALPDPASSPEQVALAASAVHELRGSLAQLSARPREVVELRLAGLTDREIAAVLGLNEAAVRQAQSRAVVQLRAGMGVAHAPHQSPVEKRNTNV